MKLHELHYTEGARKERKRIGRGTSSGTGKTAGKGQKGQNQDLVEERNLDLKEDKHLYSCVYQNVDSQI